MQASSSGSDKLAHALAAGCLTLFVCCIGRAGGMQLELQSADLKERYRTRLLYAISDAEKAAAAEELDDACMLDLEWADLGTTAEAVDEQLEGVKKKFSRITRQQVSSALFGNTDLSVLGVRWASNCLSCADKQYRLSSAGVRVCSRDRGLGCAHAVRGPRAAHSAAGCWC
jgi:hypothetical protein